MIAKFMTTEGSQSVKIPVEKEISFGQFMVHVGRGGIAANHAEAQGTVRMIKRGTGVFSALAYPTVQQGYLGVLKGVVIESLENVDLVRPDTVNGVFPLGVIEAWDYSEPLAPRFVVSFGDAIGSDGVDQVARDRADQAYFLALQAQNQFPASASSLIDENNAPFEIAAGATHVFRWYNESYPLSLDPADPSRIRFLTSGLFYVGLTDIRKISGAGTLEDLNVTIASPQTGLTGRLVDGKLVGGQAVTYLYGFPTLNGGEDLYIEASLTNTGANPITIDATANFTAFKMAN